MRRLLSTLAAILFPILAFAQGSSWTPSEPEGGTGPGGSGGNDSRAFAWYGLDDVNGFGADTTNPTTWYQMSGAGAQAWNEIFDTGGLFAYSNANSEWCYTGSTTTVSMTAAMTMIMKTGTPNNAIWITFAIGSTQIAPVPGGVGDWTFSRQGGQAGGAPLNENFLFNLKQAATISNGQCIRLYTACGAASGDCDPVAWTGSVMIEEATSQSAPLVGTAPVTPLVGAPTAGSTRPFTTDEMNGGVIQKISTGASVLQLSAGDCTAGKHVTVVDAFGTGTITIEIPTSYRVEEITNSSGDDIRSSGAYGEAITLLCTDTDNQPNTDKDILITGQKGSWVNVTP